MMRFKLRSAVLIMFFSGLVAHVGAQSNVGSTIYMTLVDSLYKDSGRSVIWHQPGDRFARVRTLVRQAIDSADYYGLDRSRYNLPVPITGKETSEQLLQADRRFSIALIRFVEDLYSAPDVVARHLKNDEITGRYSMQKTRFLLSWLRGISAGLDAHNGLMLPEPADIAYSVLKKELRKQIDSGNSRKVLQLRESINIYRWIRHFNFSQYIVVNIPSARLSLFDDGIEQLTMKVVVGKPATRTPRFATWCDKVVLYPYWVVPASIVRKELLPQFKKSPAKVGAMDMQVLNKSGKIVDPNTLQWSAFNTGYFPYTIRQCTGCDNALGVIKYNLTDPFNVYMHDTNHKLAFSSDQRYFSHGCIRLEQPVALGNALLNNKLDSNFLKACLKNQEPISINVTKPVPVFVIYLTAVADDSTVLYYRDVYRLVR